MSLRSTSVTRMTTILGLLAGIAMNLVWASDQHSIKIAISNGDFELKEVDLSYLEVGDSDTIYTEEGDPIDVTRHENGLTLDFNGKTIELLDHAGLAGDMSVFAHAFDCDEEEGCLADFEFSTFDHSVLEEDLMATIEELTEEISDIKVFAHRVEHLADCDGDDCERHIKIIRSNGSEWVESDLSDISSMDGDVFIIKKKHTIETESETDD